MCDRAAMPPRAPVPTASWQTCTRIFPGRPDQISRVRGLLADFLIGFPASDDAVLLASELATNAVTHSASGQPGGTFTVHARRSRDYLHVQIEDQGGGWDGHLHTAQPPHGLHLLRALSTACGTMPSPGGGWVTWFTLTPAPSPQGGPAPMTHGTEHTAITSAGTEGPAQRITSRLTAHGFGVQGRQWGDITHLAITGAQQAWSCLTVADDGDLRWDYQPQPGPHTSPATLAAITLHLLGAAPAGHRPLDDGAYRTFTVKGAAGRLLQDHGLKVELLTCEDLESFDAVAEIAVTSPARPGRGRVRINDHGDLEWGCQASRALDDGDPAAIVALIAPILSHQPATRPGGTPALTTRPGHAPASRAVDRLAALNDLDHHWRDAYEVLPPGDTWYARRQGTCRTFIAASPQELHQLISADHAAHPTQHHCILTTPPGGPQPAPGLPAPPAQ